MEKWKIVRGGYVANNSVCMKRLVNTEAGRAGGGLLLRAERALVRPAE